MIEITAHNDYAYLTGTDNDAGSISRELLSRLSKEISYTVPNAEFSEKYQQGVWDGTITLMKRGGGGRAPHFPSGLCYTVAKYFKDHDIPFKFKDERIKPERNAGFSSVAAETGKNLRAYQGEIVDLAEKKTRGVIAIGTGGGKTFIASEILVRINVAPAIFIVPSVSLLKQTKEAFEKIIHQNGKPAKIGMIGDQVCDIVKDGINICTYQTALIAHDQMFNPSKYKIEASHNAGETGKVRKMKTSELESQYERTKQDLIEAMGKDGLDFQEFVENPSMRMPSQKKERDAFRKAETQYKNRVANLAKKEQVRNLFHNTNAIIIDEAHIASPVIEQLCSYSPKAYYRIAQSATPEREDNQEIRVYGATGRILMEVSSSDLIEQGYLVPPKILMLDVNDRFPGETINERYENNIVYHKERNKKIADMAKMLSDEGKPTLILVDRIKHGEVLADLVPNSIFVPGSEKGEDDPDDEERDYRRRMLNKTESNEHILIATQWANTGIDAPKLAALILASPTSTPGLLKQMIGRVLRCDGADITESKNNGKSYAVVVDFKDKEKNLAKRYKRRIEAYESERKWEVFQYG